MIKKPITENLTTEPRVFRVVINGLSTRHYVVVLGDLNARGGDGEVEGVIGKYGVPSENNSGERLIDVCVEQELVIGNNFFKKNDRKSINGLCVDSKEHGW